MLNLEIAYDSVNNLILIKNISDSFTGKLWFSITDSATNLNVTHWWMILAPRDSQTWTLPLLYYEVVREFDVNVMDESLNLLFKQHICLKKLTSKITFTPKNLIDITYGSWESLVYRKEYDIKLKNDDVVYDLGGNVGTFSKWCLMQNINYVYLFEPDVQCILNMEGLFENEKDKIKLINKAILDEDKKINFYLHEHSIANTLYLISDRCVEVDCINLEKYIINNNFKKPTVIKCDIEGAEYKFIKNLSDSFFDSIRLFILEFHFIDPTSKHDLYEIIEKFLKINFSVRLTNISDFKNNLGTLIFEKTL